MKKHPIYTGSVDDALQRVRSRVNNLIANLLPNAWEKLNSAFDLLESEETEKWSNAVHSCRRILEDLADFVYPPTQDRAFNGNAKPTKLGKDEYINRIMAFLEDSKTSKTFNEVIGASIDLFWKRLSGIYRACNKGSHRVIVSQEEADRYVLNTYLIVGDILSLWYSKTKPDNLIEGLANTIFYIPEKEALMNLYYNSKISPNKLIVKPVYPLGTGTSFVVLFRRNAVELDHAFDLRNLFYQVNNFFPDEFKKDQYLQIGTHEFSKNKNPLLLIAIGDGVIHLDTIIISYTPAQSSKDISEKNWKIVGRFSGQTRAFVEHNEIYFPYGTQGLRDTYKWVNDGFIQLSDEP